jgi:hypothetical protein
MKIVSPCWHSYVMQLALVVCLILSSCSRGNREVNASLDYIEAVVQQHPDSALHELMILDSLLDVGTVRIEGDRQQARYALLKTQTHDKNFIDDTNDSLILHAVRYYDDHGSKRERMLAHFYHGAIFRNAKDYGAAFFAYRQAEIFALELGDNHYLSLIYGNLSALSADSYSNDAISYGKKSLTYARLSGNIRQTFSIRSQLGQIYSTLLTFDTAEFLFRQVLDSLPATDPIVQGCLTSYIEQCMTSERYELADSLLDLLKKPILRPVDLMNKACLFQIKGLNDSADVYINLAERAIRTKEQRVFLYEKCSWIAKQRKAYTEALEFIHNRFEAQNDVITAVFSKSVSDYQRDFELQQKEHAEYRNAEYKRQSALVAAFCLLLAVILFSYLYHLFKKRSLLLDEAIMRNVEQCMQLENQETTVSELRSQIETLQLSLMSDKTVTISSKLSKLLAKRFKLIDRIGIVFFSTKVDYELKHAIFDTIKEEVNDLQSDNKTIKGIDLLIDEYTDGAMTKAKKKEMNLNEKDIELLRYMLMNLSNDTILYLLNDDNRAALNKRKDRLKQKIKSSECVIAKDIIAYLSYKSGSK